MMSKTAFNTDSNSVTFETAVLIGDSLVTCIALNTHHSSLITNQAFCTNALL